ncbi:hypothetical protein V2J09_016271 [Rumex salicifolius]
MLRRSLLELSARRLSYIKRVPRQITAQNPSLYACSLREFSTTPKQNVNGRSGPPPPSRKSSESEGGVSKALIGSVAIGTAMMVAYSTGYLDPYLGREPRVSAFPPKLDSEGKNLQELMKESGAPVDSLWAGEQSNSSNMENAEKSINSLSQPVPSEDPSKTELGSQNLEESTPAETNVNAQEELPKSSNDSLTAEAVNVNFDSSEKESIGTETLDNTTKELKVTEEAPSCSHADTISQDNRAESQEEHLSSEDKPKDVQSSVEEPQQSLLDEYNLSSGAEGNTAEIPESGNSSLEKEAPNDTSKNSDDMYLSKDGKLILDFLQALHAAEQRQAELDACIYSEEKRLMKEKYEKDLKDARARELMYAQEVAMLEKEIKKETAKSAAALKSLQEKAEERLNIELEQKEKETELKLKEVQEFAKAKLAVAIAGVKAAQLEEMAEANINALCMAFYARSEEARQTHSVHKLALGALALEDALSKGLPIQPEVDAIRTYPNIVDNDTLIDLVLSSLPEEIHSRGTDTPLQLNQKASKLLLNFFDEMKGQLRHFSLIPPGGGGILTHSLAYIASFLKVKEADKSGNGIESVINRVQSLLAEGKLAEAADILESGVQGSDALNVVGDWVKRARNRAISEQALMLLHSYTTCMSLT